MRSLTQFGICIALCFVLAPHRNFLAQEGPAAVTVLRAAHVLEVRSGEVITPGVVVVRGGRIVAVGSAAATPTGATVIDLPGLTLMPGLIDVHVHLFLHPGRGENMQTVQELTAQRTLQAVLAARAVHSGEIPALRIGSSCFVPQEILRSLSDAYASLFPDCRIQFAGGDPVQLLRRMKEKNIDASVLLLPISGSHWVVERVASAPLVICMRTDDPLAQHTEVQPPQLGERLKIFRSPEAHPEAHTKLMEMLAEIGIEPEVSCLAATPADIQWMVKSGSGLALIDQKTSLDPSLTTRPIANVNWTAGTAFVHPVCAEHLALPILIRHFRKANGTTPAKRTPRRRDANDLQMKLLA